MTKFQEQLLTALYDISNSLYAMAYPVSDKDENKDQLEFDFNKSPAKEKEVEAEVKTPPISLLAATLSLLTKEKESKQVEPVEPLKSLANENTKWKEEEIDGIKFYFKGNPNPTKLQIQRLEKQYQRTYCALRSQYTSTLRKEAKQLKESMQEDIGF